MRRILRRIPTCTSTGSGNFVLMRSSDNVRLRRFDACSQHPPGRTTQLSSTTVHRRQQVLALRIVRRHLFGMKDINQARAWTQTDDEDLNLEVSDGRTIDHAATFLCRPSNEVMKRAAELGLRWAVIWH